MWLLKQAGHRAAQRTLCFALTARACESPVAGSSRTSGSYALLGGLTILYEGLWPSGGVGARRATYGFFLLRAASNPPWTNPSLGCSPACRAPQQQGAACLTTPAPRATSPPAPHPQPPTSGSSLMLHPSALAGLFMCASAPPPQVHACSKGGPHYVTLLTPALRHPCTASTPQHHSSRLQWGTMLAGSLCW